MTKRSEQPAIGRLGILAGRDGSASDVEIPDFDHHARRFLAPGTTTLVFVFLAWFVAMFVWASLNYVTDRDIDRRLQRTRGRPAAGGRVRVPAALAFAAVLLGLSLLAAALLLGPWLAFWMALGVGVYAGLDTQVLERHTHHTIVIGGAAGSCATLAGWGWVLADPGLAWGAWWMAVLVFLRTPPHFWGLAIGRDDDDRTAGVPMLPQVRGVGATSRAMFGYALASLAFKVSGLYLTLLLIAPSTDVRT